MKLKPPARINLLPADLRPKRELPTQWVGAGAIALVVVIFAGNFVRQRLAVHRLNAEIESLQAEELTLRDQVTALTPAVATAERDAERATTIQSLLNRRGSWSTAFREISHLIPDGVWLSGLTTIASATADGTRKFVLVGETQSHEKMAEFFAALESSRLFHGATLEYSEKIATVEPALYRFRMLVPTL